MQTIVVRKTRIGKGEKLAFICGPCVMENEEHTLYCAERLKSMFEKTSFSLIFKASYDKANRSSIHSFRGPGLDLGLKILQRVQSEFDVPVLTDIHTEQEATIAGDVCDMIQIPAFLCRQTDLILAAGKTKAAINVKKGQFLSPWEMKNVVEKLVSIGCQNVLLTERGASFGYNNLVSDMRSIPIMQKLGFPVCFDASHSAQLPGGMGTSSGGQREFIPTLAKAAVAAGCNSIFLETHPDPMNAKSDAATVFPMDDLEALLHKLERIYDVVCV
jgi:2-dehydro-3-deoxyphosphooctonate aldolase (KDO 8-P synthase)